MTRPISTAERLADIERELAALKLNLDEEPGRNEWRQDIEEQTPRTVFAVLVMYLSQVVPGFSAQDLQRLVKAAVFNFPERTPENAAVFDHVKRRTTAIIDEMLPPGLGFSGDDTNQ